MRNANLMLHCGAGLVDRDIVAAVATPAATRSWQPLPHIELLESVERRLHDVGLQVVQQAHGLTHDRARYFGLLQVSDGQHDHEYCRVIGVRNSHDKRFPAGLCAGSQVFVCDNLAFVGEIRVARKHTVFIRRDLPALVVDAVSRLSLVWQHQEQRIACYKTTPLSDVNAHHLTISALDAGVISSERVAPVLRHWREPEHDDFRPRNLWSWFNAVTEVVKGRLHALPQRTQALYGVCDGFAHVN